MLNFYLFEKKAQEMVSFSKRTRRMPNVPQTYFSVCERTYFSVCERVRAYEHTLMPYAVV